MAADDDNAFGPDTPEVELREVIEMVQNSPVDIPDLNLLAAEARVELARREDDRAEARPVREDDRAEARPVREDDRADKAKENVSATEFISSTYSYIWKNYPELLRRSSIVVIFVTARNIATFRGWIEVLFVLAPFWMLAGSILAVSCHRLILLSSDEAGSFFRLRPRARDLLFLGFFFLFALVNFIIVAAPFLASPDKEPKAFVIPALLEVLFLLIVSRLIMVFPAVAVGQRRPIRHAWTISRGYVWKIVYTYIGVMVPIWLVSTLTMFLTSLPETSGLVWPVYEFLVAFIQALFTAAAIVFLVTALSFLYKEISVASNEDGHEAQTGVT